jgi:pilus assembly protein Flp/PilA
MVNNVDPADYLPLSVRIMAGRTQICTVKYQPLTLNGHCLYGAAVARWIHNAGRTTGVRLGSDALRIIEENRIMKQLLKNLLNDESGQDLIEYALIAALIALVAITGLNGLASKINSEFTAIGGDL